MKRRGAFTLIELLVVIAIIGLLLAILVPGLKKVKEYARNIVCRTNTRSLSLATALYAEENKQQFFEYKATLFIVELDPYIDNADKVRYCPSTVIIDENPTGGEWGSSRNMWRWAGGFGGRPENGSYGLSGWCYSYPNPADFAWIGGAEVTDDYLWPVYGNIKMPSYVPVFFDCVWVDAWPKHSDTIPANFDLDQENPRNTGSDGPVNNHIRRMIIRRHNGDSNIAFADGHTEAIELKNLWNLKWNQSFITSGDEKTRVDDSPIYRTVD